MQVNSELVVVPNDKQTNKTDSDSAGVEKEACVYGSGFKIHHCPRAFNGDYDCVHCWCDQCYNMEIPSTRAGRSKKRQKTDGCQHERHDLKLEENEMMLARKNNAQKGKKIPERCSKCQKLL